MTSPPLNPFFTLEAAMEHLHSAQSSQPNASAAYHLEAAEEYVGRLFQALVLLLPGLYASSEGEVSAALQRQLDR